jgi:DNA-binding transcriptional ArsR family regulator
MSLDRFSAGPLDEEFQRQALAELAVQMAGHAEPAAALLKALSHEGRLKILFHLAGGERSVTELEALLGQRQAAVSQQLARLRLEGLVSTRREGKAIFYSIQDSRVLQVLLLLQEMFAQAA